MGDSNVIRNVNASQRIRILIVIGIAFIGAALLLVRNGAESSFGWTYPACIEWYEMDCPHRPNQSNCQHEMVGCARTRPRVAQWVYIWLVETGLVVGLLAVFSRRDPGPQRIRPQPSC